MSNVHQSLMDKAYERWNTEWKGIDYDDFVTRLDYAERLAVMTGNLNYQVENGGWVQWFDNGYGKHAQTIRMMLNRFCEACEPVAAVVRIMDRAVILWKEVEEDDEYPNEFHDLDKQYYAINADFLAAMETILTEVTAAK